MNNAIQEYVIKNNDRQETVQLLYKLETILKGLESAVDIGIDYPSAITNISTALVTCNRLIREQKKELANN